MKAEYSFWINKNHASRTSEFWLARNNPNNDEYLELTDNGVVVRQTEGCLVPEEVRPFLSLPTNVADIFVQCILDYAAENNIKGSPKLFSDGKLEMAENQIANMKDIIFKFIDK